MPTWAPDGERLAYVVEHDQGMDIYSINVDGRERTKLTQTGVNMTPAWSPDGGFIAYASADCGNCAMHIWIMRSDGTEKHAITFGEHRENVPTWSPDGKHLAFTSNREGGLFQIWIVNLEDLSLTRLTNAYYNDNFRGSIQQKVPAWSPDGTTIAYWQGIEMDDRPEDPTLPREVWVMNADGSNPRALTSGDDPAWSADGTRIIFPACSDLGPFSRILSGEGCELAVAGIDLDGSNKRVLFLTNGWFGRASWQPFGKKE